MQTDRAWPRLDGDQVLPSLVAGGWCDSTQEMLEMREMLEMLEGRMGGSPCQSVRAAARGREDKSDEAEVEVRRRRAFYISTQLV